VLLVDKDKENISRLINLFIEEFGVNPEVWHSRRDYRAFLDKGQGGVALIKIDNPAVPGLELTKEAAERYPAIRVVWMADSSAHALDIFSCGAEAYLLLPATVKGLREIFHSLDSKEI
jgi:DNA-binding NtrC family response regulator